MRILTGWVVAFLLPVAAGSMSPVSAAPVSSSEINMSSRATPGQGGVPAAKGRLKFKSSGPVCMCAEGMSERDIEQAMAKSGSGKIADKIAGQDSGANRGQAGGQEKTLNSGVAK